jgi:hypothetical protein
MTAVQGATDDRILYWPVATAAGCALTCLIAYPGPFLKSLLYIVFVPFGLATFACDGAGIAKACPLATAFGIAGPYFLYAFFIPLLFLFWGGAGVTVAMIAAMNCVEHGLKHTWRRLLSTLILLLTAIVAAANLDAFRRGGDYVYLSVMYPRYTAEISRLPADKPRFKVWSWADTAPCGIGVAYDESDATGLRSGICAGPFEGYHMSSEVSGTPVSRDSGMFRHFYFVTICPLDRYDNSRQCNH